MRPVYLQLGDTLVRRNKSRGTSSTYVLEGWSSRGKGRWRTPTGGIMTAWWLHPSDVPKHYEVWRGEERLR